MKLNPGDYVIVTPADAEDPMANDLAGKELVIKWFSSVVHDHVICENPDDAPRAWGRTARRYVLREKDLRKVERL